MKITHLGETLTVSELPELCSGNSESFREEVCNALPSALKTIELDLSQTRFIDSCGLGALVRVYKTASRHHGAVMVRLVNPTPPVQQMVELTRLHRIFELVQR